jgi:hypothetical protein
MNTELVNAWLDRHSLFVAVLSCFALTLTLLRPF